jgi:hypothetical protein
LHLIDGKLTINVGFRSQYVFLLAISVEEALIFGEQIIRDISMDFQISDGNADVEINLGSALLRNFKEIIEIINTYDNIKAPSLKID